MQYQNFVTGGVLNPNRQYNERNCKRIVARSRGQSNRIREARWLCKKTVGEGYQ